MDSICNKMGMCINASKTELMAYDPQSTEPLSHGVQLSGGIAKYVDVFKYLGGIVSTACDCALEVRARIGKALGRFAQMKQLWGMRRMPVTTKMRCYSAYVLPILLFGCETWALTQQQLGSLERVHSSCLRQILGVRVSDRHKLVDIRKQCGTVSLADHISAARLRWFGHIVRMEHGRIPHIALFSTIPEKSRPRGRPPQRWISNVLQDLQQHNLPTSMHELTPYCEMRGWWRSMVYKITHPDSVGVRRQRSTRAGAGGTSYRHQWRQRIQQQQLNLPQGSLCPVNAAEQAAAAAAARAYYDMW
jgi:hypothetical protein